MYFFFPVRKLEQLDHPKIFNYVYLVKFFFGRRVFIRNYYSFFNLGRYFFNFDLVVIFSNTLTCFMPLTFIIYDLQPFLNTKLLTSFSFSSSTLFS